MLATKSPQMRKAVGVLKELSADEQTRMLLESQEMARRDIASIFEAERKKLQSELQTATTELAEQAAKIADKDAEIARLRAQLETKKS